MRIIPFNEAVERIKNEEDVYMMRSFRDDFFTGGELEKRAFPVDKYLLSTLKEFIDGIYLIKE